MFTTKQIFHVNTYGHKNTAAIRKAYKEGKLVLSYDRNSTINGAKIYKANNLEGRLKAEFHVQTSPRKYKLDAHIDLWFSQLTWPQQCDYTKSHRKCGN